MKNILLFVAIPLFILSCKKQDKFLDLKATLSDVTPIKLEDFQALLDNDQVMNKDYPSLPLMGSDNYYLTFASWQASGSVQAKNAYIWASNIYEGEPGYNWRAGYKIIEYANIVLSGVEKIKPSSSDQQIWNNVKGSALFFRAYSFYNLAQTFAKPYSSAAASTDLGLPLRLSEDINEVSVRASLEETYVRIIKDLKKAKGLLPLKPLIKTRPSKLAADALLARVFLTMEDYDKALEFANLALSNFNLLIDFNTLDQSLNNPFPSLNTTADEVIFYAENASYGLMLPSNLKVDTTLYSSYNVNDLRKIILFKDNGLNGISFRGHYTGYYSTFFAGLGSNEIYLIKAECEARLGNTEAAMVDLNTLLGNRWLAGTFVHYTARDAEDALKKIIAERRKELPFTGSLRWEDLRRLNKDSRFAIELTRNLNGQIYRLSANDRKYAYPFPDDEIRLSGIQQNPR